MALPGLASQAAEERHQVVSAIFLDRDGVINANLERNGKPVAPTNLSDFRILPGVAEAARLLKEAGFLLVIVTNQPDVANGLTPKATVEAMHAEIMRQLPIDDIIVCFHAGGLRYHGMAPLVSLLQELGLIQSRAYTQSSCFEAGIQFARTEGILPAPEANHAVRGVIEEALRCKSEGVPRTILFNLCGHGHFDMQAYIDFHAGKLEDRPYDEAQLDAAFANLPRVAAE